LLGLPKFMYTEPITFYDYAVTQRPNNKFTLSLRIFKEAYVVAITRTEYLQPNKINV